MLKAWFVPLLCTAAFGSTITYNYVGNTFDRCNGTTTGSGNCPGNFTSDFTQASFTFNAPLAGGLSSVNEIPSVTSWSISDGLGAASFASTDVNAASELQQLMLSTNASGGITGWGIEVSNFVPNVSGNAFFMLNPTIIGGGTGLPLADALQVNGGGNGGIGPPGPGYNLGNSVPGTWTETLNDFQGGSASSPVFLLGGSPIGEVTGTIGGGSVDYYVFNWGGGAFSATATVSDTSSGDSFLFSGGFVGTCDAASQTLNSGDGFTGTISVANLAPGQYCIGLADISAPDPNFTLKFNTPIGAAPEPSEVVLLCAGLAMIAIRGAKRLRQGS